LTPSTTTVVVQEVHVITPIRFVVSTQAIVMNPFGYLFCMRGYNSQSIPSISNHFSFVMPNTTLQLSTSILVNNKIPSIGPWGMAPLHIALLFGGDHIPQMTLMVGSQPPFPPRSNPSINAIGWSNQPGRQTTSYIPSFPPSSSTLIPINMFGMKNPPLSSRFPPIGSWFHTMGNPHPGAPLVGGNVYNPHYTIPTYMVPTQPLMNYFGGGYYKTGQVHGAYQNSGWVVIPQHEFPHEHELRCRNPDSFFWPRLIFHTCQY
jgi:hypothetical protein